MQRCAGGETQRKIFLGAPVLLQPPKTFEPRYAVRHMDHVLPFLQVQHRLDWPSGPQSANASTAGVAVIQLVVAYNHKPLTRPMESTGNMPQANMRPLSQFRM